MKKRKSASALVLTLVMCTALLIITLAISSLAIQSVKHNKYYDTYENTEFSVKSAVTIAKDYIVSLINKEGEPTLSYIRNLTNYNELPQEYKDLINTDIIDNLNISKSAEERVKTDKNQETDNATKIIFTITANDKDDKITMTDKVEVIIEDEPVEQVVTLPIKFAFSKFINGSLEWGNDSYLYIDHQKISQVSNFSVDDTINKNSSFSELKKKVTIQDGIKANMEFSNLWIKYDIQEGNTLTNTKLSLINSKLIFNGDLKLNDTGSIENPQNIFNINNSYLIVDGNLECDSLKLNNVNNSVIIINGNLTVNNKFIIEENNTSNNIIVVNGNVLLNSKNVDLTTTLNLTNSILILDGDLKIQKILNLKMNNSSIICNGAIDFSQNYTIEHRQSFIFAINDTNITSVVGSITSLDNNFIPNTATVLKGVQEYLKVISKDKMADEIVIDNSDTNKYSTHRTWINGNNNNIGSFVGDNYQYITIIKDSENVSANAKWTPQINELNGKYAVYYNKLIYDDTASVATITVKSKKGQELHTVDLRTGKKEYYYLGIYEFSGEGNEWVELYRKPGPIYGTLRADAIKFVRIED